MRPDRQRNFYRALLCELRRGKSHPAPWVDRTPLRVSTREGEAEAQGEAEALAAGLRPLCCGGH